jgi:hypothetical protein
LFGSAKIKNSSLNGGIKYYEIAIHKFLGNSIIKRLEGLNFLNNEEIRQRLKPDTEIGLGEWVDVSGLATGTYLFNLSSESGVATLRVIRQ